MSPVHHMYARCLQKTVIKLSDQIVVYQLAGKT